MVKKDDLVYPLVTKDSGDPVKVVTLPLPVIASTPDEGVTVGALTAFLVHNSKDEVTSILAPQINYNQNFGTSFSIYGMFYPSPKRSIEVNLAYSTRINDDYEFTVKDKTLLDGKLDLNIYAGHFTDGSSRFFGFQSNSTTAGQTNYANQESGFNITATYPVYKNISLELGERFRYVEIKNGAIRGLPFIKDLYTAAEVPGINGFTAHAQKIGFVYSTLDSKTMPTSGTAAEIFVENSAKVLGSDADYRHYGVEGKGFIPIDKERRYITAFRLLYNQTLGGDVPFLERSILGGENTLRGYGRNRFIDSSALLLNLEERIRVFRWEIFGVNADWELAPFIDLGSVMKSLDRVQTNSFEFNPGLGIRAVVRPNIVGRLDIGWGNEGIALYVGLGYPF
ncbi:MAG: outer membrane protein assembly factor [Desulfuromonadales bacterium]|nr:outer membrane protein assembly factor [Desulfuromonadales bacterium]